MGLRERLAAALAEPGRCEHAGGESCDQWWRADAALPAVVAWLREEADQRRAFAYSNPGNDYLLDQAVTIQSCVDSITGSTDG